MMQSSLPLLPEAYVPDVAPVQAICTRLRNMGEPVQVVQIVGEAGQGAIQHPEQELLPSRLNVSRHEQWLWLCGKGMQFNM